MNNHQFYVINSVSRISNYIADDTLIQTCKHICYSLLGLVIRNVSIFYRKHFSHRKIFLLFLVSFSLMINVFRLQRKTLQVFFIVSLLTEDFFFTNFVYAIFQKTTQMFYDINKFYSIGLPMHVFISYNDKANEFKLSGMKDKRTQICIRA